MARNALKRNILNVLVNVRLPEIVALKELNKNNTLMAFKKSVYVNSRK